MNQAATEYVLGSNDPEVSRLEAQAAFLEAPSRALLEAGGIEEGMSVLDLGAGLGHVSLLLAELVGSRGRVLGVERDPRLLQLAMARADGRPNVRFVQGDVRSWRAEEPVDAIVERLLLFHLPDGAAVLRRHLGSLRAGGRVVALDFDIGGVRTEPSVALAEDCRRWILAAFRSAKADPVIGARLALLLAEAGVPDPDGFAIQTYLAPGDPRGPGMLAAVVSSLAPQIISAGIATAEELELPTLRARLATALRTAGAVLVPPALVGAWGRMPEAARRDRDDDD